ncbi:NUDIX domain-containing protein [Actinoplanes sp. NPDC049548]|uniref:NUDIX domain-containing protein n=1 Tax=Actinoplanes sp. NPDC049548 TaxID=3155152 RepID=UPI003447F990
MPDRFAHCTFCGARFTPGRQWPRRCAACGETSYRNPTPVAVALQPVGGGLLAIRRGIPPAEDRLALPGGFIELGETWQEAAARELWEEAGLRGDPDSVRLFDTLSAPDGTLLVFGLFPALATEAELPAPAATGETRERLVLHEPQPLGFELHTRVADHWFAQVAAGL